MSTRNVALTDHHEEVLADLVRSGRFQNASEVLREGLRLVEQREAREADRLKTLQEAAHLGFRDLEGGRHRDVADNALHTVIEELGQQATARLRDDHR